MKSKLLKTIGEVILLISYLAQTLLFDYYNDKSNSIEKAYINQSLIDKGAELKEIKYFIAKFSTDTTMTSQYQKLNINSAAQKIAQAQIIPIVSSKKTKNEKIFLSNLLMDRATRVQDFDTYQNFIAFINYNSLQQSEIVSTIDDINTAKSLWRFAFIGLYIIGTGLLIFTSFLKD